MYQSNIFPVGFICCFVIAVFSCESIRDWEIDPAENGQLVVEAILTNELKTQEVKLSQSFSTLNGEAAPVIDATVNIEVNRTIFRFQADDHQPGLYKSEVPFAVLNNLDYHLVVDWEGVPYSATSELSEVAPIPQFTFTEVEQTNSLTFDQVPSIYNANQQAMYEINIDWSHLEQMEPIRARTFFYTFNTVEVSGFVPPPRDTLLFPAGSVVAIKKFGLNDDFAAYLKALVIETQWRGGFFYSDPASLPTNISNGGLGFFSTCAVLSDTLIAE